ncbi:MAG: TIM barrel protein [Verrucomicrobiota bacterium]|nr:TIM barrel protein [Verrucomicrobiota bacterium]
MIKTGLVSITLRNFSVYEIVNLVKKSGLDGIEWSGGDIHVPEGDTLKASEARILCEENGIDISSYGSYYRAGYSEKEALSFSSVMDCACEMGASTIRVWAGQEGSKKISPQMRGDVVSDLHRIADYAKKQNISITLEYHNGTLTDNDESVRKLMQELDATNILFSWQPPLGFSKTECSNCLETILPKLGNIHVFQWGIDKDGKLLRLPLEKGRSEWLHYFSKIKQKATNNPQCYAMLEFVIGDSPEQFLKDAITLKQMMNYV